MAHRANSPANPLSRLGMPLALPPAMARTIMTRTKQSIEKGIVKTMQQGVISGNPMVDIRCTLVDGKFHSVDSSDMAFQLAGSLALKEAATAAGVVLLEPIVEVDVVVPEAHTGDIMGDLNAKRAKIQGVESASAGKQRVKALVPQADYADSVGSELIELGADLPRLN